MQYKNIPKPIKINNNLEKSEQLSNQPKWENYAQMCINEGI